MFEFQKRDDGFMVFNKEGRAICSIDAATTEFKENPKLKDPEKIVTKFKREEWRIHFCGVKLTTNEVLELVTQIGTVEF